MMVNLVNLVNVQAEEAIEANKLKNSMLRIHSKLVLTKMMRNQDSLALMTKDNPKSLDFMRVFIMKALGQKI